MSEVEVTIHVTKYMVFRLYEHKPKTTVWHVLNKASNNLLAVIEWYSPWRQYVFFPIEGTLFNNGCLEEIVRFLGCLNEDQKAKRS